MIIEGLLVTHDADGAINVAPMGPRVHGDYRQLTLRPFKGSTTFENLQATKSAVFHVVDTVDVIAKAVCRRLEKLPPTVAAEVINGFVLEDCCRWFELSITDMDLSDDRTSMTAVVKHAGERRPFRGFNRACHAVIEGAILASRIHLLPKAEIMDSLNDLAPAVEKTGGRDEVMAFEMIRQFIEEHDEAGSNA